MKLFAKLLAALITLVILIAVIAFLYVKHMLPNVGPPPDITVEANPERLERGIGNWTRAAFIARFKLYQTEVGIESLRQAEWNTEMP